MGKYFVAAAAIMFILFVGVRTIPPGVHDWRTDVNTQNFIVTTAPAETEKEVVLTHDLFLYEVDEVHSITSTIAETPVATDYNEVTNELTVSALDDDNTRTLTIVYYSEVDDTIMQAIGPFLNILIFLALIGGVVWGTVHRVRGR